MTALAELLGVSVVHGRGRSAVHALREGQPVPEGVDPYCSDAWRTYWPPLIREPWWWMLRVGVWMGQARAAVAA